MIIGERFAWAHMGKTGGDAVYQLFALLPDLVLHADEPSNPRKHHTFRKRGAEILNKPILALNIRRLPSWQLSIIQHRSRHGDPHDPRPVPIPPADEVIGRGQPDHTLLRFTDNGTLTIHHWLRIEHLRTDFITFVSELRSLKDEERQCILEQPTKSAGRYNHDVASYFTEEQIRLLYERNPVWTSIERRVYGDLLIP